MKAPFPTPTTKWHDNSYPSISPSRPELSAKGKNVLITGGGTGIGAETARRFAEAGASRIALLGRREQPLLDTKKSLEHEFPGLEVAVASTDVTKKSDVDAAFAKFAGNNSKIDVLISGAAMTGPMDSAADVDGDKLVDAVVQNLTGAVFVGQAFVRYAAPSAVAVNISSFVAHFDMVNGFAAYSVAKMAVVRFWDSLAFGNPDLSVFHLQPGVVDTDMNKQAGGVEAVGFQDHVSLPACFCVWLASPEARFLKGRFLWSNWDVDELKSQAKEIEAGTRFKIGLDGWPFGEPDWKFQSTAGAQWST